MEIEKLKSCPFCGGEASLTIPSEHVQADCADIYVSCDDCEAEGQHFVVEMQDRTPDLWPYEQRDAIAAWNTRAPAELTGWQAIETAPKDGTIIDVWRDGTRETVYWGVPPHECGEMGSYCDSDWHSIKKPGWVCSTFGEFVGGEHDPFTHWQPLPAPPGTTRAPADLRSALEAETIERAARAMCVHDGLDPDEHIIGGQASGFEDYGPLWQAEQRSDGQLGITDYAGLALAALAPTKGDVS